MLKWLRARRDSNISNNGAADDGGMVAVLRLRGELSVSASSVQDLFNIFPQLSTADHVALVVTLETAGGTLTCVENIMGWVNHLYRQHGRPIIAVVEERCLSAGLAIAAHCDYVIAQPSAMLGAFGVMMSWPGAQSLRRQIGLSSRVYKTAPLKDFASPYREPTSADENAILHVLQDMHDQFAAILISKRQLKKTAFEEIADGRLITGRRALELGLVDQLGGMHTAFEWLSRKGATGGEPPYRLIFLGDPGVGAATPSISVFDFLKNLFQSA